VRIGEDEAVGLDDKARSVGRGDGLAGEEVTDAGVFDLDVGE